MEHTHLVAGPTSAPLAPEEGARSGPGSSSGARPRAGAAGRGSSSPGEVLYKRAADVDPGGADGGAQASAQANDLESSHLATPPQDLSVLVNQLYAQIKRELMIERERRGGLY